MKILKYLGTLLLLATTAIISRTDAQILDPGPSNPDRDAGVVLRENVSTCPDGDCSEQDIYISDKTVKGLHYITAKNSAIYAGRDFSYGGPCTPSLGEVVLKGLVDNGTGKKYNPRDESYRDIADVDFRAGTEVVLSAGFTAEEGCNFHAYISPEWDTQNPAWVEEFDYDLGGLDMNIASHTIFLNRWKLDNIENLPCPEEYIRFEQTPSGGTALVVKTKEDHRYKILCPEDVGSTDATVIRRSAYLYTYDQVHTKEAPYGRYEMRVRFPEVGKVVSTNPEMIQYPFHSVWLLAQDGPNADEIDNYERNDGALSNANQDPRIAPRYAASQMSNNHGFIHPQNIELDVKPYIADNMPRWDGPAGEFVNITVEWERYEIRFLINDCVVSRFPNMHANDNVYETMGGVNLDFTRDILKSPPVWWIYGCRPNNEHMIAGYEDDLWIEYLRVYNKIEN